MDPLSFSRTKRVVLLIDLHPLLCLPNPSSYTTPILSAARRILSFPPLSSSSSSSLFAFKLFFSSLSPISSTSRVHRLLGKSPTFLSFDRGPQTLQSLADALNSLRSVIGPGDSGDPVGPNAPRAALLARSLLQLEHDYGWEPESENPKGMPELLSVRSNLVVMFSPISQSSDFLWEYVELEGDDDDGSSSVMQDAFLKKFLQIFGLAKERLVSRDVHLSWVDVNFDAKWKEGISGLRLLEKGIRELGWGFSSTDAIMLGAALVPFGFIYPHIGCPMGFLPTGNTKKELAELVLEISDVSGKPLVCKSCDLEVLDLNLFGENSYVKDLFSENVGEDITKIQMRRVVNKKEGCKVLSDSCGFVLLRGISGECRKDTTGHSKGEFLADRILQLLCIERGELAEGKPVWQLLLAFLYNRNYWGLVSISCRNGNALEGILIPFMVSHALLKIVEKDSLDLSELVTETGSGSSKLPDGSVSAGLKYKDGRRRRNKKYANLLQNATWSSFREVVFGQADDTGSEVDLEEAYFSEECNRSKKLRFLKCWMRQIKKSSADCQILPREPKEDPDVKVEAEERFLASQEDHHFSSSADETHISGSADEEASPFSCLKDSEAFLGSIPQKIKQGLSSKDVDLGFLAERLVSLSIHALYIKLGRNAVKGYVPEEAEDVSDMKVAAEVSHLLLRRPKDLESKYKGHNPESLPSYSSSREHEVQILLRMEIFRSKVGASIEENVKQKMIKEVCSLLHFIDLNLQGYSFSAAGVLEFAERTIKSRYANSLGDVICKIYKQMEFNLSNENEVEASDLLPNSSNNELKRAADDSDKITASAIGLRQGTCSFQATHLKEKDGRIRQEKVDKMHEDQLMNAQARRNRDRRFSSFTSWMPDLQRVWALKQPQVEGLIREHMPKRSKRRKRRMAAHDMVCETPMTGKRNARMQEDVACSETPMTGKKNARVQEDDACCEINSCRSVSKALFHHEEDFDSGVIS